MFRCSSTSLLYGNHVTFTIVYNTQPGEILYLAGSHPQIGWDVNKAKRMTWNVGNIWDIKVGFPSVDGIYVQYKYFVYNEYSRSYRWENIENREIIINDDGMIIEDQWEVKRTLEEQVDDSTSIASSSIVNGVGNTSDLDICDDDMDVSSTANNSTHNSFTSTSILSSKVNSNTPFLYDIESPRSSLASSASSHCNNQNNAITPSSSFESRVQFPITLLE
ncbi:hypothetical protein CYY_002619 [Polysphondylium violaceum]|uniref:CBM20 domain-containing protein n=1 Tax=Polysphondylium violaceum TaxID=133409 RepID=A0A8J4PZ03_9MYCE|nr:hypothetical protein CYY_002619 [Polysphondylium violaceum]